MTARGHGLDVATDRILSLEARLITSHDSHSFLGTTAYFLVCNLLLEFVEGFFSVTLGHYIDGSDVVALAEHLF